MTQTQKTTQKTKTTATNKKDRRYELAKLRQQVKACGYDYRQVRSMSRGELESILLACKDKSEKKSEKKSENKSENKSEKPAENKKDDDDDLATAIAKAVQGKIQQAESSDTDRLSKLEKELSELRKKSEKRKEITVKTVKLNTGKQRNVGIQHKDFRKVVKVVAAGVPTMLVGPSGCGKTHTAAAIAEALDLTMTAVSCSSDMYKSELTGYMDAEGKYIPGSLYEPFANGGLFVLDEMDAAPAEVLVALNSAVENGHMNFPCGRVKAHDNFRVIACANTFGHGATNFYSARNQIDVATLRRYAKIQFGYDRNLEKQLITKETRDILWHLREKVEDLGARLIVSTGQGIKVDRLVEAGFSRYEAFNMLVITGADERTEKCLKDIVKLK